MPGYGLPTVKREPVSDEEDSNSQIAHSYLSIQLPSSEILQVNLQSQCGFKNVPADLLQELQGVAGVGAGGLEALAPAGPAATPVCVKHERGSPPPPRSLQTLRPAPAPPHAKGSTLLGRHMGLLNAAEVPDSTDFIPLLTVKDEPLSEGEQQQLSGEDTSDSSGRQASPALRASPKSWTQRDMECALDALRTHQMSLTKASAAYGIPSTTLWQRAHRLGIDTPKKEGAAKCWRDADLRAALHALRAGDLSANKASKAYGIPSSTLYKIARREGIRLSAPFNAAPTAWRRADLQLALAAIRAGAASVQRAAAQYGIPTGTLYGRCKREGIELSRSNPTPWSEDAMGEALEAVRVGQMSINQAAIHYNLPYSSLYGRFKRCKYQIQAVQQTEQDIPKPNEIDNQNLPNDIQYYQQLPHSNQHHSEQNIHPYTHPSLAYQAESPQEQYGPAMYYSASCSVATS